ncbi:dUTP diphosphatase [Desulfatibacillum aliphaticivorans]|uniref:dUTP diphosphatase n=1 Tax=Desulfatibacillum aliphaticivorans TaxID=218208 RepID=UPI000400F70F|nr:dUTP diphosphatase [Desulfatibacillum aliphaticivorans]
MLSQEQPEIRIKRLNPGKDGDLPLPRYMTPGSAGMDICAALDEDLAMAPGDIALVPTGLAMAIPQGFEVQVRPRSGLAIKQGVSLVNTPGTIDSDYRGEVKIGLINLSRETRTISRGDRIAQLIVGRVFQARLVETDSLDETERNSGGFGHTGV